MIKFTFDHLKLLDFLRERSVFAVMPNREKLRELAADIMSHLEDAHSAALKAQQPDITVERALEDFEAIRVELREVDNRLSLAERLIAQLLQT